MHHTRVRIIVIAALLVAHGPIAWARERRLSPEAYQKRLGAALDAVAKRAPDAARCQIRFGVNLFLAHEAWVSSTPEEALVKAVDAFNEAGVDRIDINPGLFPWLDGDQATMAKYDAAVERIRYHGLHLGR